MKSMLLICRAVVWITCVVFLITARKTKKRSMLDCVKWCSLGSFLYIVLDIFLWPWLFDVQYGVENIIFWGVDGIAALFLLADAFICQRRSKTIQKAEGEDIQRWFLLYLLVAVCFFATFALEWQVLQDAHLLFVNTPDGLSGDYYSVAVNDVSCIKIELGEKYYKKGTPTERHNYVAYWDRKALIIEEKNNAPAPTDDEYYWFVQGCMFNDYVRWPDAQNADDTRLEFAITKIANTDYFVVTYYRTTVPKEVQVIVGQALFLREKFVNNIEMPYTDEIYYYD